jgi:hypothetical protein
MAEFVTLPYRPAFPPRRRRPGVTDLIVSQTGSSQHVRFRHMFLIAASINLFILLAMFWRIELGLIGLNQEAVKQTDYLAKIAGSAQKHSV